MSAVLLVIYIYERKIRRVAVLIEIAKFIIVLLDTLIKILSFFRKTK